MAIRKTLSIFYLKKSVILSLESDDLSLYKKPSSGQRGLLNIYNNCLVKVVFKGSGNYLYYSMAPRWSDTSWILIRLIYTVISFFEIAHGVTPPSNLLLKNAHLFLLLNKMLWRTIFLHGKLSFTLQFSHLPTKILFQVFISVVNIQIRNMVRFYSMA